MDNVDHVTPTHQISGYAKEKIAKGNLVTTSKVPVISLDGISTNTNVPNISGAKWLHADDDWSASFLSDTGSRVELVNLKTNRNRRLQYLLYLTAYSFAANGVVYMLGFGSNMSNTVLNLYEMSSYAANPVLKDSIDVAPFIDARTDNRSYRISLIHAPEENKCYGTIFNPDKIGRAHV